MSSHGMGGVRMATVSKRGRFWRARIRRNGVDLNRTFDTRRQAEVWGIEEEARLVAGDARKASAPVTCRDLFERYAKNVSPLKRGFRWEVIRLRALGRYFAGSAAELTGETVAEWRDERLKTVGGSTVNRDMNLLGAVFTQAIKEWGLKIPVNPVHQIKRPASARGRNRRVSDEERDAIVKELGWNGSSAPADIREWIAWCFDLALATAMRRGEILSMEWKHVHARHVHLPMTKNGESRDVPLSTVARGLIGMLTRGGGRVVPVMAGTFSRYFAEAAAGAGYPDLNFHDSRHEATTRISRRFGNVLELSAVTGHRDLKSLRHYYHPKADDLANKMG